MDKTLEKVTKDPRRVKAARKDREKYMNKLRESNINDAKKVAEILAMKLPSPPTLPPPLPPALPTALPTLPAVILMSTAFVYLLSLS